MPLYSQPLEEINESIQRPIAINVLRDLLIQMGLPEDSKIMFKGKSNQFFYEGSDYFNRRYIGKDHNRYEGDSLTYVDFTEEDNEQALLTGAVWRPEERAIFNDPKLGVLMWPSMVNKKATISITLKGTEKQVERWRAILRRKTAQGVIDLNHMVQYHYPIPTFYMIALLEIHRMRENIAGYNEEIGQYLREHFIPNYTVITNPGGHGSLFVIKETQLPIQGWFSFGDNPPQQDKDNDSSAYSLTFDYSYWYDCPETMSMKVPLTVHNQMLPAKFIKTNRIPFEMDYIVKTGSYSQLAFDHFRFNNIKTSAISRRPGIPIPYFDDWLSDVKAPPGYETLVRPLTQVDPSNPNFVLNLDELGYWKLNPIAKRYLKGTAKWANNPYSNLFLISLYAKDEFKDLKKLHLTPSLDMISDIPLELREHYHMTLSLLVDITRLNEQGWEDLMKYPCLFVYWLSLIAPELVDKYNLAEFLTQCELYEGDDTNIKPKPDIPIDKIIEDLDKDHEIKHVPGKVMWYLVGGFSIWSHRFEEALDNVERY